MCVCVCVYKIEKATINIVMYLCPPFYQSVRPYVLYLACLSALENSAPTGRIFIEFDIRVFFQHLSRKIKFN